MTLDRAVEILNAAKHRGTRGWGIVRSDDHAYVASAMGADRTLIGVSAYAFSATGGMFSEFEAIAIAEKLEDSKVEVSCVSRSDR